MPRLALVLYLAFIAVALTLRWALTRLLATRIEPVWLGRRMELSVSYLIGILATYWCLERGRKMKVLILATIGWSTDLSGNIWRKTA